MNEAFAMAEESGNQAHLRGDDRPDAYRPPKMKMMDDKDLASLGG